MQGTVEAWGVDWSQPWLQPLRALGEPATLRLQQGQSVAATLHAAGSAPVRFVPQADLPPGEPYERYIHQTRCVPTRDNLHDFFNGLCWLQFPQTKTRLNQLQAAEIAAAGVQPLRGPVRDALTVFDENAAFLLAPPPLWDALRARDWRRLFVTLRPLWSEAQLLLFGHALLEKLVYPRKPIVAHVYCAPAAIYSVANLDAEVAAQLSAAGLAGKPFAPLPVLGVPGWWAENAEPAFYADAEVFRPPRQIA
ncbi:hypothetical protein J2X19_004405 [Rhodoferax ferrireducens]|uniref:Transmembrane protein n=1 Tax=Rhodoferax ferrireducens TaxID=192843 RepID=A0ABU2CEF0_9BURK|nr:DUF3025 domain-containing protein [Rhodoferax ferrireducens]MDR7379709.1 hypothetical protein [Rhodoferax ferrireducens]